MTRLDYIPLHLNHTISYVMSYVQAKKYLTSPGTFVTLFILYVISVL